MKDFSSILTTRFSAMHAHDLNTNRTVLVGYELVTKKVNVIVCFPIMSVLNRRRAAHCKILEWQVMNENVHLTVKLFIRYCEAV